MDKNTLTHISQILYAEIEIGTIILQSQQGLSVSDLKKQIPNKKYSEIDLSYIIKNLVSYGIVSPAFNSNATISYCITDFGKYYFDKLIESCDIVNFQE